MRVGADGEKNLGDGRCTQDGAERATRFVKDADILIGEVRSQIAGMQTLMNSEGGPLHYKHRRH